MNAATKVKDAPEADSYPSPLLEAPSRETRTRTTKVPRLTTDGAWMAAALIGCVAFAGVFFSFVIYPAIKTLLGL